MFGTGSFVDDSGQPGAVLRPTPSTASGTRTMAPGSPAAATCKSRRVWPKSPSDPTFMACNPTACHNTRRHLRRQPRQRQRARRSLAPALTSGAVPQQLGWVLDLKNDPAVTGNSGERYISSVLPILESGLLTFVTLTPSGDVCGGSAFDWTYNLDYLSGGAYSKPVFYDTSGTTATAVSATFSVTSGGNTTSVTKSPSGKSYRRHSDKIRSGSITIPTRVAPTRRPVVIRSSRAARARRSSVPAIS